MIMILIIHHCIFMKTSLWRCCYGKTSNQIGSVLLLWDPYSFQMTCLRSNLCRGILQIRYAEPHVCSRNELCQNSDHGNRSHQDVSGSSHKIPPRTYPRNSASVGCFVPKWNLSGPRGGQQSWRESGGCRTVDARGARALRSALRAEPSRAVWRAIRVQSMAP